MFTNLDALFTRLPNRTILVVVSIFVILSLFLGLLSFFSNKALTATQAYVKGEGHWSKAQKQAIIELYDYIIFEDSTSYRQFRKHLEVNEGDRIARQTLSSKEPDFKKAQEGFLKGNNHPDDIDQMIWLFDNFHEYSFMRKTIQIWGKADQIIEELRQLGNKIHLAIQADTLSAGTKEQYSKRIRQIDHQLTDLENSFSAEMGNTARQFNYLVFWIALVLGALLLLVAGYAVYKIISEFQELNRELRNSREKFKQVLGNSRDIIYEQNLETEEYEYVSEAVEDILGFTAERIQQEGPDFIYDCIHPEDDDKVKNSLDQIKQASHDDGKLQEIEYRIQTRDGNYVWVNNQRSLITANGEQPARIVGNVRDISKRKEKEVQLNKSLEEKQLLLSEIHHRVKNNLAVISGILMLQAEVNDDEQLRDIFEECQNRIASIAEVHDQLYKTRNFSEVELEKYLENLMDRILENTRNSHDLEFELSVDATTMKLSKAVHFGLLINELVTNSIKHAFPHNSQGRIFLNIEEIEEELNITYADNGVGLDSMNTNNNHQEGIGMKLITTLLNQLGASYDFSSGENGFQLEMRF